MNTLMMNDNPVYVQIYNYGGYFAEFVLACQKYDETKYTLDSGIFSVGFGRRLDIQPNTQFIYMTVTIWIFGGVRTLFEDYVDSVTSPTCYELKNTIFDATINKVPCNGLGGSQIPNCCCNCCSNNPCCSNNCCCQSSSCCNNIYGC